MNFTFDSTNPKFTTSIVTIILFVVIHLILMFANTELAMSHVGIFSNAILAVFAGQYLFAK